MRIENTSPDFNKKMINWGRPRLIGHKNITMGHVTKKFNREGFSNRIPTEVQAKLQQESLKLREDQKSDLVMKDDLLGLVNRDR